MPFNKTCCFAKHLPDLLAKFQMALYRHYNSISLGNQTLYHPSSMKLLADTHAPNLFDKIFQFVERKDGRPISQKTHNRNLQRTVGILHIVVYFRQVFVDFDAGINHSTGSACSLGTALHTRNVMTASLAGKLMGWWAYSLTHPFIIKLNKRANYVQGTSTRNE